MRYSRLLISLFIFLTAVLSIVLISHKSSTIYSIEDVSAILDKLDLSSYTKSDYSKSTAKLTDNNEPRLLQKHEIENKVNDLLKKKLEEEIEIERNLWVNEKKMLSQKLQDEKDKSENLQLKLDINNDEISIVKDKSTKLDDQFLKVYRTIYKSNSPDYLIKSYSFRSRKESNGERSFDSEKNDFIILSSFFNSFGKDRSFEDFFLLLDSIKHDHSRTSIAFLIGDDDTFELIDDYVSSFFKKLEELEDYETLPDSFSRITLMQAKFVEEKLKLDRVNRHGPEVQRERRRVLSQMRNFLVTNGIQNEKYSLFMDSDIIEFSPNIVPVLIEEDKDISVVRIDVKNVDGNVVHSDYDLNSWAGSRTKPTLEEQGKLDDPNSGFFFEPKPGHDKINLLDAHLNPSHYGIDSSSTASLELKSVGGAVLFAKTEIYKQGILFPPFYIIGTSWERKEGYDGIETEGLCYQANVIGYKCYGFPNLVAYHTIDY
ncbi:hypothetical protein WICMUC_000584 [Wickerhamomyces mucosus]|uniref:Uncharacterized protein n=1 Tax=Wickerhamomyces mucosus TaxID=1378264 RepID=A0A9P8PWW1_9ASCO|nr:hypothetical protein WICMUC_000584 [Wickerhamomyces mucosus]